MEMCRGGPSGSSSLPVTVHESRVTNVQDGTELLRFIPATSIDVAGAPNTATQTQLGVADRSAR
jgi:hypothetical protein